MGINPVSNKNKAKTFAVCLLAAAFFWLMNALTKDNYSIKLSYPIQFTYNDSAYVPVQPLPNRVSVNVSGDGWKLLRKSWLSFSAPPLHYAVLNPLTATTINTTSLTEQIIDHFPDIKVNYVVADTLELAFEKKATKIISIRVDSLGINLRDGYVVSSLINVSPSLISVEGPASIIKDYPSAVVVKVPTTKLQDQFDDSVKIPLPVIPLVKQSHTGVWVSFEVARLLRPLVSPEPAPVQ